VKVKPKVLIFVDWFLPGYKAGGPIQSCANLIEHLKDDYEFYIVTRNTDYCSDSAYPSVISDAWNLTDLGQCYYISKRNLGYFSLKRLIKEIAPDVIYINGIYSLYFSILPLIISLRLNIKNILVASRGMLAKSAINIKGFKKFAYLKLVKFLNIYKNVTFHATNTSEANDIYNAIGKSIKIITAPNLPKKGTSESIIIKRKIAGELKLINIARISPEKNLRYALETLSRLNIAGTIIFDIFGPIYNELYWQECRAIISRMPTNITVNYKGSLESSSVASTLLKYHTLFLPTKGENFGHIILESLTAGCPVLISNQTPWTDLKKEGVGYDIPLQDISAFQNALVELLNLAQEEFDEISNKAYNFALQYIQNTENLEANKALFK
jgi:glycosyltransferase involved in cell wall biosynthesis